MLFLALFGSSLLLIAPYLMIIYDLWQTDQSLLGMYDTLNQIALIQSHFSGTTVARTSKMSDFFATV